MDTESFNKLSLEEKGRILDVKGAYLSNRSIYNKSAIHLYKVNDFFAERFYDAKTREHGAEYNAATDGAAFAIRAFLGMIYEHNVI